MAQSITLSTLQAGRGVAAISVAAFHLSIMMGETRYGGVAVFREFTHDGNSGVDFFFVLSGFIILFGHFGDIGDPRAIWRYLYRRFARLYPIYWAYTLVFALVLALVGGANARVPARLVDWITSLTLIRLSAATPPLPPAWTLFHEVAFYLAFSILILSRRVGILIFLLFAILSVSLYHFPHEDERTPFNVYTSAYNLYFLFGMGAYWLFRKGGSGIPELALSISAFLLASLPGIIPPAVAATILAFGMALLVSALAKFETKGMLRVPVLFRIIGDASYTIYLTHSNFEGTALKLARATHLHAVIGGEVTYLVVLFVAITAGCFAYQMIERPILRFFRQYEPKKAKADGVAHA